MGPETLDIRLVTFDSGEEEEYMRVIPQWVRGHDDQGCRGSHRCG